MENIGNNVESKETVKEVRYLGCSGGAVDFFVIGDAIWEIERSTPDRVLPACTCCMSYSIKEYYEENKLRIPNREEETPDVEILNRSRNKAEVTKFEEKMIAKIESLMRDDKFSDAEALSRVVKFTITYDENKAVVVISKNSEVLHTYSLIE
jgi:hypothetical protein